MKTFIVMAALALSISANAAETNPTTVNEKVMKTFNEVFKGAENVAWNESARYAEVSFTKDNIVSRAILNNEDGSLLKTIRYYKENHLPANVLYRLKSKYAGKEIFGVTEITDANGVNYSIVIRDAKNLYNVDADTNGSITTTQKLKRADL